MSWSGDIRDWAGDRAIPLINAVAKKSVEKLSEKANTSRFQPGGLTPVDTSFLINSFSAKIGSLPYGESQQPENHPVRSFDSGQISAELINWTPSENEHLFLGWTANYAADVETRYGFWRLSVQDWDLLVSQTISEYRTRFDAQQY